MVQDFRNWLRSDMKILRWVLLGLYVLWPFAVLVALSDPERINVYFFPELWLVNAIVFYAPQAIFILGGGTPHLGDPVNPRRLCIPVAIASATMAFLSLGAGAALSELFQFPSVRTNSGAAWCLVFGSWLFWGVPLWFYARRRERGSALARLVSIMFIGSLIELLTTVPVCLTVVRHWPIPRGPYLGTGVGPGLYVMIFSFGLTVVLVFLRPRYRREMMERISLCPGCGYDLRGTLAAGVRTCPECGAEAPANAVALPLT